MLKQLFIHIAAVASAVVLVMACDNLADLSNIESILSEHEARISKLEKLCSEMNTNISSMQAILESLADNDYITSVAEISSEGKVVGYTLTFAKHGTITIYNGLDGKDGQAPKIGVKQDSDGQWYWTIDGEWLKDDSGNKIKAVGRDGHDGADGADGADGKDGKDAIVPQLKIENGYWYISYDLGKTWSQLGKATGENGADGKDGVDGKDGGDTMFSNFSQDENYFYLTLASDGSIIAIPKQAKMKIVFDVENADNIKYDWSLYYDDDDDDSYGDIHDYSELIKVLDHAIRVPYHILNASSNVSVTVSTSSSTWFEDFSYLIEQTNESEGVIYLGKPIWVDELYVNVLAVDGNGEFAARSLYLKCNDFLSIFNVDEKEEDVWYIDYFEQDCKLDIFTNREYKMVISPEAESWMTPASETKAFIKNDWGNFFHVSTNKTLEKRSGTLYFYDKETGALLNTLNVVQTPPCTKDEVYIGASGDFFQLRPGTHITSFHESLPSNNWGRTVSTEIDENGKICVKAFFGVDGYDLEFYLARKNGGALAIIVLNAIETRKYYGDPYNYYYKVATGINESYLHFGSYDMHSAGYNVAGYNHFSFVCDYDFYFNKDEYGYDRTFGLAIYLEENDWNLKVKNIRQVGEPIYKDGFAEFNYELDIEGEKIDNIRFGYYVRNVKTNQNTYYELNNDNMNGTHNLTLRLALEDFDIIDYDNFHAEADFEVGTYGACYYGWFDDEIEYFKLDTHKLPVSYDINPDLFVKQWITSYNYNYNGCYYYGSYKGEEYATGALFIDHIDMKHEENWFNAGITQTIMKNINDYELVSWSSHIGIGTEENFAQPLRTTYHAVLRNDTVYKLPSEMIFLSGSYYTKRTD